MTVSVAEALGQVPVTRLIHFAPATNVSGIFTDNAIRTSQDLVENAPQQFSPTDELRLDARNNHVCCSFEYPNAYYQAIARDKSAFRNCPDWVAFILDLDLVLRPGTLFSPCNAAKGSGAFLKEGGAGLLACWSDPSYPGQFSRSQSHRSSVPTDLQSEVLIPGLVPLSAVSAIVTATPEKARELFVVLHDFGLTPGRMEWRYAPLFFDKWRLANALQTGGEIPETQWTPSLEDLE